MIDRARRPLVVEGGQPAVRVDIKRFKSVPESGIRAATDVMRDGATFRYGAGSPDGSHVAMFEREFAELLGFEHAVAVNSCGSAMFIALRIAGVNPGDRVLQNAFTFTAVPSAIHHAGALPLLVESDRRFTIDIDDLERKARLGEASVLLLSYMRGHVPDMDEVVRICREYELLLVEDCAHALCTSWRGVPMGQFGRIACYSTQSSKALSSGEGGVLCTNDPEVAAKAVLYSGSYERNWAKHFRPPEECSTLECEVPGYSMRMPEVTGAMLRPQISRLAGLASVHRSNLRRLTAILESCPHIDVPLSDSRIERLGDTLQFHLVGVNEAEADRFVELAKMENIPMQIFGRGRNARDFRWWRYLPDPPPLPGTEDAIAFAVDLCLGAHLTTADIDAIGDGITRVIDRVVRERPASTVVATGPIGETFAPVS